MEKSYFEYNGEKYLAYSVNLLDIYSDQKEDLYTFVAGEELFDALEEGGLLNDDASKEVVNIDEQIFFYCDDAFIHSNPTYEELVKYLRNFVK